MLHSRLHRMALAAAIAVLAIVAAVTLGRAPEPAAPIETERQAGEPDDLSAALGRCATLDGTQIEEAGCMAVWEENRRRFFGGQARPHAPVAAPVLKPVPGGPTDGTVTPPDDLFPAPDARSRESLR